MPEAVQKSYDPELVSPPTKEEKAEAHATHQQILALISEARVQEQQLDANYVKIGVKINTMQAKKYWIILGYASWTDYFDFLQSKFGAGRTQLYHYLGIAKTLLPTIPEQKLIAMGVSKASELKRAVQTTGQQPSDDIIELGTNPKVGVHQFRAKLHQEQHIVDDEPKGVWFDFKGCYLTEEEKKEILQAFDYAKKVDPVIPTTWAPHAQFKEIMLRLAREFTGTWAEEVDRFQGMEGFDV